MLLFDLLYLINDNCIVELYNSEDNDLLAIYDGKESIPEDYDTWTVWDIFSGTHIYNGVEIPTIYIEIGEA